MLDSAQESVCNGLVGLFQYHSVQTGTRAFAQGVAASDGYTLAGGGDTIAAIEKFYVADTVDYISTAGRAFLEYLEGKELPALVALAHAQ